MLKEQILLRNYTTLEGSSYDIPLTYQCFGRPLHTAPIVLVLHALTGNSDVASKSGWWKEVVAEGKPIDTQHYTIISFNIPGNGYDNFFFPAAAQIRTRDIAAIFLMGLSQLNISKLYLIIGGSIGGAIGWSMLAISPNIASLFVPIATHYKTSDWLFAQCTIQKYLLENEELGLQRARQHAMLCYRTPNSFNDRFNNSMNDDNIRKSTDWLIYHGNALSKRFYHKAYQLMNNLLMTIENNKQELEAIDAEIHLIGIDTDLFFTSQDMKRSTKLSFSCKVVKYHEIQSPHGHDAFLIEFNQLNDILKTIIQK